MTEPTMRAAVLHEVGDLRIDNRPAPTPARGEVLIKVAMCGVCGSDATEFGRHLVLAKPPVALGHEFVGVVAAVGECVTSPRGVRRGSLVWPVQGVPHRPQQPVSLVLDDRVPPRWRARRHVVSRERLARCHR